MTDHSPQYIIEGIILRRIYEKRIEGYTIETAKEIAEALAAVPAQCDAAQPVAWRWKYPGDRFWTIGNSCPNPLYGAVAEPLYAASRTPAACEPVTVEALRSFIYTRQPAASREMAEAILEKFDVRPKHTSTMLGSEVKP